MKKTPLAGFFNVLIKTYPAAFRREYQDEMRRVFKEQSHDTNSPHSYLKVASDMLCGAGMAWIHAVKMSYTSGYGVRLRVLGVMFGWVLGPVLLGLVLLQSLDVLWGQISWALSHPNVISGPPAWIRALDGIWPLAMVIVAWMSCWKSQQKSFWRTAMRTGLISVFGIVAFSYLMTVVDNYLIRHYIMLETLPTLHSSARYLWATEFIVEALLFALFVFTLQKNAEHIKARSVYHVQ